MFQLPERVCRWWIQTRALQKTIVKHSVPAPREGLQTVNPNSGARLNYCKTHYVSCVSGGTPIAYRLHCRNHRAPWALKVIPLFLIPPHVFKNENDHMWGSLDRIILFLEGEQNIASSCFIVIGSRVERILKPLFDKQESIELQNTRISLACLTPPE